jgi:hypothetical protein
MPFENFQRVPHRAKLSEYRIALSRDFASEVSARVAFRCRIRSRCRAIRASDTRRRWSRVGVLIVSSYAYYDRGRDRG